MEEGRFAHVDQVVPMGVGDRYDSGWYDESDVALLTHLIGTWTCQMGSIYRVTPDEVAGQACCNVKTFRPNGQIRITKALIRAKCGGRKASSHVVWGEDFVLEADPAQPDEVHWVSRSQRNKPYQWWRIDDFDPIKVKQEARRMSLRFSSDEEDTWTGSGSRRTSGCSTEATMPPGDRRNKPRRFTMSPHASPYQSPRGQRPSGGSLDYSNFTSTTEQDRLCMREATMSLREATVVLKETYQEQREFDTVMRQRTQLVKELTELVHEVTALEHRREQEKTTLKRYREEQHSLRKKLRRCREVVGKTVDSIDDIFAEAAAQANSGGQAEEANAETVQRIRRRAEEAEAAASALLATMDASSSEERTPAASPEPEAVGRSSGSPVNCLDVAPTRVVRQASPVNCLDVATIPRRPPGL